MSVLRFFQRRSSAAVSEPSGSAAAARDRLKVLVSHERTAIAQSRLVEVLREEILAVIGKHVAIERDKVQMKMDRSDTASTLAIDIELPALSGSKVAA
ncbi:MAG: cell division topological specificity factor MinE [Microvirga sp.]|jgi:cell division topological specificity factor